MNQRPSAHAHVNRDRQERLSTGVGAPGQAFSHPTTSTGQGAQHSLLMRWRASSRQQQGRCRRGWNPRRLLLQRGPSPPAPQRNASPGPAGGKTSRQAACGQQHSSGWTCSPPSQPQACKPKPPKQNSRREQGASKRWNQPPSKTTAQVPVSHRGQLAGFGVSSTVRAT